LSYVVREFSNISELIKSVDDAIAELRRVLGEHLKRIEELRIKAEQESKLKSILVS